MRLVLLTDLHFGRASPDLVQPLLDSVAAASPDLVLISGDFVQRARASQFRMAREFLDRLRHDWIAVPGNHDIPLFNVFARALMPRAAFQHWVTSQTEPFVETDDAFILGVDTTHRWSHQRGLIRPAQIARIAEIIRAAGTSLRFSISTGTGSAPAAWSPTPSACNMSRRAKAAFAVRMTAGNVRTQRSNSAFVIFANEGRIIRDVQPISRAPARGAFQPALEFATLGT
ncbi:MAG: metallophosphoesterase [Loktanella sp.]|nr:metallophosphoesterase [Loktanella sp.]